MLLCVLSSFLLSQLSSITPPSSCRLLLHHSPWQQISQHGILISLFLLGTKGKSHLDISFQCMVFVFTLLTCVFRAVHLLHTLNLMTSTLVTIPNTLIISKERCDFSAEIISTLMVDAKYLACFLQFARCVCDDTAALWSPKVLIAVSILYQLL